MKKCFKLIALVLAFCAVFSLLVACSKEGTGTQPTIESDEKFSDSPKEEKGEAGNGVVPFEMDQLEWKVAEGIVNGERKIVFNYTNKSKITILEFAIKFREKSDMDPAEKDAIYQYLIAEFSLNEEEGAALKVLDFAMSAEGEQLVKPGEKSINMEVEYFDGYYDVQKIAHFDQVEPDVATIRYVYEGKIHTAYYDFIVKNFSKEEKTQEAVYWTESSLGTIIPKPDSEVVEKYLFDSEDYFGFTAWGMHFEDFEAYRDMCAKKGFKEDVTQFEGYYIAKNAEGYGVTINFDEDEYKMHVDVSAPEDSESETNL